MITPTNQLLIDAIRAVNILTQEVTQRLQTASTLLSFAVTQTLNAVQQSQALSNLGLMSAPILLSSAGTVDIGAAASARIVITGTTQIGSFSVANKGIIRTVRFDGVLTLVHSAGILLVGSSNIVTAQGDTAEFESLGSGVWRMTWYNRVNGLPLVAPVIPVETVSNLFTSMTGAQALSTLNALQHKTIESGVSGTDLVAGKTYTVDTSAGAFSMNLPATGAVGDQVELNNHLGSWKTNNLTVTCPSNGRINGILENLICDCLVGGITLKCTSVASGVAYWTVRQ